MIAIVVIETALNPTRRNNNVDGFGPTPLTFEMGSNVALPGLEEGIVGMRKGGIRRIIVPSELGYGKFPGLEPRPTNTVGKKIDLL